MDAKGNQFVGFVFVYAGGVDVANESRADTVNAKAMSLCVSRPADSGGFNSAHEIEAHVVHGISKRSSSVIPGSRERPFQLLYWALPWKVNSPAPEPSLRKPSPSIVPASRAMLKWTSCLPAVPQSKPLRSAVFQSELLLNEWLLSPLAMQEEADFAGIFRLAEGPFAFVDGRECTGSKRAGTRTTVRV